MALASTMNESLSDSINLFQAIHVLQVSKDGHVGADVGFNDISKSCYCSFLCFSREHVLGCRM